MSKKSTKSAQTKKAPPTQTCGYDFTLFDEISSNEVRKTLSTLTKKYAFQLEKGEETGKLHYQGRFSLKIKKRKNEAINQFNNHWKSFHLSITSNENKNNNFYVLKEETRVDGPFTNENEIFIPKDVEKMKILRPWQKKLIDMLSTYDERQVDIIYDETGNIGKTSLVRYMMCFKDAEMLPFCNDYKDIMRMTFDIGPKKCYLIDMPRAINKDKLSQFFAGIETLKSGYCYDDRYKFQRRLFDKPRVCVFTNTKPDLNYLSKDMWKIWEISNNLELIPYVDNNYSDLDLITDNDSEEQ